MMQQILAAEHIAGRMDEWREWYDAVYRTAIPMSKGTILVVDDDPAIVAFLDAALTDEGYEVATASGAEAVRVAHEAQPALILLDLMMPGMDGIEVCHRLRADPRTAGAAIVMMSAQDRLRDTARVLPIDGRLPKPFDLDFLYATVAHWTTGCRGGRAGAARRSNGCSPLE